MWGRGSAFLSVGIVCLALVAGCGEAAPRREPTPSPTAVESDAVEYASELTDLTNEARVMEGLETLEDSACARTAALERATALVGEDELEHAPLGPVIDECAPRTTAAENLVNSSANPAEVLEAWLGSPGHRANIVDPVLTEIGIGCVPDGGNLLCSQVFLGP